MFASAEAVGSRVHLQCASTGSNASASCFFNLEGADYIAIRGFEMSGGKYGVRAVGPSYTSTAHQVGIAVLDNVIHDQSKDPIFTGQSDWTVVEGNEVYNAGSGDGHGIYLSNGSDWGIVRQNELYQNASSDLQINADPISTCQDERISYTANICDGAANAGQISHRCATQASPTTFLARMSAITPLYGKKPATLILAPPAIPLRQTCLSDTKATCSS